MNHWTCRCGAVGLLVVAGLLGCTGGDGKKDSGKELTAEEKQVKAVFEKLQKALDDRNEEKIWDLLDDATRMDALKAAQTIKDDYAKADDKKKDEMVKRLTFEEKGKKDKLDLAALTGKTVLRTKPFHDKHHEKEESKFDKVEFKENEAKVLYIDKEPDPNDFVMMVKQKNEWKVNLVPIPR